MCAGPPRNGDLTLALTGQCLQLLAGDGRGGSGRAPGWCVSLLQRCCGGAVCWQPAICLPTLSVIIGEVCHCVGMLWQEVVCMGVLRNSVPNGELNPIRPDSGCPLQAGTGHGLPGRAPGLC